METIAYASICKQDDNPSNLLINKSRKSSIGKVMFNLANLNFNSQTQ